MKKTLSVLVVSLLATGICFAGSIIMPFWQNGPNVYSMFIILNTSPETANLLQVMFYGKTGNPQAGYYIEDTIPPRQMEIYGTGAYPDVPKMDTGDSYGYVIATETGGMLYAVGLVYDNGAHAGYPIRCFPGDDGGGATEGW